MAKITKVRYKKAQKENRAIAKIIKRYLYELGIDNEKSVSSTSGSVYIRFTHKRLKQHVIRIADHPMKTYGFLAEALQKSSNVSRAVVA